MLRGVEGGWCTCFLRSQNRKQVVGGDAGRGEGWRHGLVHPLTAKWRTIDSFAQLRRNDPVRVPFREPQRVDHPLKLNIRRSVLFRESVR